MNYLAPQTNVGGFPGIRVLHCIGGFGGGGAERQLSYLAAELVERGVDLHIAFQYDGPNLQSIQRSGAVLHRLYGYNNYDPRLLWQLARLIRRIKPDLVHTWLLRMDVLAGLVAVFTRTPFLMGERSVAKAYEHDRKSYLRAWIGRQAGLIVANSDGGREYWLSRKGAARVKVIRNGFPVEDIRRTPAMLSEISGLRQSSEILLFAGRYDVEKNLFVLLDAIELVLSKRPNMSAIFFGEGPLKEALISKVRRLAIQDRVTISGYTAQLWAWMKSANLFVSISSFEGSPNTILEAAIQGCPLVVSDIPQHRELLTEDAAYFVSPFSPPGIARGIAEVLDDPQTAKRKAQHASEIVSRMTVDSVASEYLKAYMLVLSNGGPVSPRRAE